MENRTYNIVMDTPVGSRYGTIRLNSAENHIHGTMDLLGHSEPFDGTMDGNGNCTLNGRLITLMRTIEYTAIGKITEMAIELSLQGERNIFRITGIAASERHGD
ncbi:MAG: hypothetical protein ACI4SA_02670 [Lachnospiraceae bacterium]